MHHFLFGEHHSFKQQLIIRFINSLSQSGIHWNVKIRFKLQKNHTSQLQKLQKNVKSKTAHLCLRTCFCSKINKTPKTHSKLKKNQKNISFLKSISTLKFLTTKFLQCNIYQLSNDNINYVPKANLPKQNRSSWLFVQKIQKKTKKSKNPKAQK